MKLLTFVTLTLFYVGASKASAQVSNPTAPSDTIVVTTYRYHRLLCRE